MLFYPTGYPCELGLAFLPPLKQGFHYPFRRRLVFYIISILANVQDRPIPERFRVLHLPPAGLSVRDAVDDGEMHLRGVNRGHRQTHHVVGPDPYVQHAPCRWYRPEGADPQANEDRKSTRLNSSHYCDSRMPSSA